ncbi:MAG: hypothetical protein HYY21_08640 [Candidatus Tectomicrobia bacterium]|nr:hypothetical protein [Candidatus Tectomicrobia bacterium]
MCFFCGCVEKNEFQSVKVILPPEIKERADRPKREASAKRKGAQERIAKKAL